MSRNAPDDWDTVMVGDVVDIRRGITYVASELTDDKGDAPLYVNMKSFLKDGGYNVAGEKYYGAEYRPSDLASRNELFIANTDVTPAGDIIGAPALVPEDRWDRGVLCSHHVSRLVIKKKVFRDYLYYLFCSNQVRRFMKQIGRGTTVKMLDGDALRKLNFLLPPHSEQQKIATILSSVDDVIEKTRAQIEKLKDLKTGMTQELLTQGIGHTEFKDSPVGRIPFEWDVYPLRELASFVTSGSRGWAKYYSKSGAPFIRIGNLTRDHINLRFTDTVYVRPPDSAEGRRTRVQAGDILISITADLGVIGVINDSIGEAYVNQHVSLVRLNEPSQARWVGHFLASDNSQKQFIANNDTGAKSGLNLTAIRNMHIAMPEEWERRKIVSLLDSTDSAVAEKEIKLGQALNLKKALMQDLLTGKVRVNVDQKESEVA
ncbi:restriction endonuclease subunit S [Halospina sp. K52047b]|uniref:restriction endonuclease subunit S n=1 Tax=Halospina sp. K52047b TaxID=2614160 RepID=UPI00124A4FB3|nr:restriction endonuclease subunit S [Halospina sp. K52047b]KAA8984358.1 restriction endonuclease subunit S [Halospina sp. K52047b]